MSSTPPEIPDCVDPETRAWIQAAWRGESPFGYAHIENKGIWVVSLAKPLGRDTLASPQISDRGLLVWRAVNTESRPRRLLRTRVALTRNRITYDSKDVEQAVSDEQFCLPPIEFPDFDPTRSKWAQTRTPTVGFEVRVPGHLSVSSTATSVAFSSELDVELRQPTPIATQAVTPRSNTNGSQMESAASTRATPRAVDGLKQVANFRKTTSADVVFVHGLEGDEVTTWKADVDKAPYWPELLGQVYPHIRVWSLGYNTSWTEWKGNTLQLTERARHCVNTLVSGGVGERPIVFIAHSLGGLVVKEMLSLCDELGTSNGLGQIIKHTRGIVFLATPHLGSQLANYATYLGSVLRASVTVKDLEYLGSILVRLNDTFRVRLTRHNIGTAALYETQEYAGVIVVNRESADAGCTAREDIFPAEKNHKTISKPTSRSDPVHATVCRYIDRWLPPPS